MTHGKATVDRESLRRFIVAAESGKRPAAVDLRAAAAFIRDAIQEPSKPFAQQVRGRGRPALSEESMEGAFPKIAFVTDLYKLVGDTPRPDRKTKLAVAESHSIPESTADRWWKAHRQHAASFIALEDAMNAPAKALDEIIAAVRARDTYIANFPVRTNEAIREAIAEIRPEIDELVDQVGKEVLKLRFDALREWCLEWRNANFQERSALRHKYRGILDELNK